MRRLLVAVVLVVAACSSEQEPTTPPSNQSCAEIGHPYEAKPGDPRDRDGDGTACEEFS